MDMVGSAGLMSSADQLEEGNSGNASWAGEATVSKTGYVGVGQLLENTACFELSLEHRPPGIVRFTKIP